MSSLCVGGCGLQWSFWWGKESGDRLAPLPNAALTVEQLNELMELLSGDTSGDPDEVDELRVRLVARNIFRVLRLTWEHGVLAPSSRPDYPSWGVLRRWRPPAFPQNAALPHLSPAQGSLIDVLEATPQASFGPHSFVGGLTWARTAVAFILHGLTAFNQRSVVGPMLRANPRVSCAWWERAHEVDLLAMEPADDQETAAALEWATADPVPDTALPEPEEDEDHVPDSSVGDVPVYSEMTPSGEHLGIIGSIGARTVPPGSEATYDSGIFTRLAHL